ncbi:Sec63-domain-containing protein [Ephemerocybe angulata]|uniref:Sec63-domain-containing protein n=1 Tax=Ephemerocybe angulata TaxID=980116 RepID=A0A8H6IC33_9AGAR|nr:Sec63-domain-containing protein [Tulosesus angulatus]
MTSGSILEHIGHLVGDNEVYDSAQRNILSEWTSLDFKEVPQAPDWVVEETDRWQNESAIWTYVDGSGGFSPSASTEHIWQSLDRKPELQSLLDAILATLSKDDPEEDVSTELVDIIGYDDIELVFEITANRSVFKQEAQDRLSMLRNNVHGSGSTNPEDMFTNSRQRIQAELEANAARPLDLEPERPMQEQYPGIYTSSSAASGNMLSQYGTRYSLPMGTVRQSNKEYEEVIIPPPGHVPPRTTERLILINELDPLARGCFAAYKSLNRIQSIVFPTAYKTNENMLVAAPTGAGKTDVALLTILRVLDQFRSDDPRLSIRNSINTSAFKIIYVAPMKALASEITRKFSKRLHWLGINVRELTGDMQLTKAEIAQTQVIVTTPEKWDVVTRKPTGEGELASSIKLLILDEVHLLNEERGAVIETIVARTLRQVESTQSMVRIVGLSATLPNYIDVSQFLSVNPYKGLFYFDSSFRPVPLEQHFIGVRGKPGSALSKKNLDHAVFQKVTELVDQGHQVMIFVHARKETVKTAMQLKETILMEGDMEKFSCEEHPQFALFRRELATSRNKEMKLLFDSGFGIHHAGMLRSDRNLMEKMFEARAIKVLCCTATLAWGVNLPAHAVIIKGTQIYDTTRGAFTDLSVLDVLQIFGRAGRPGLETSGEGYICTTEDKLPHYLDAVTSQVPIESKFQGGMIDSINAEISLGTVANIKDAVQWLGFTYLFVRMQKNPFIYGIDRDSLVEDPRLGAKRTELVKLATKRLAEIRMVVVDSVSGSLQVTDLGRVAAKYYIRYASIEIFNKEFRPRMTEADVLAMLSMSTEFAQIQLRESEMKELEELEMSIPCQVKGGVTTSAGKVNILLQAYISRTDYLNDFALVSDMAYVAQNAGRIIRALLEISISRKWAHVTATLMSMSKAIEKRLWPFEHPLKQSMLKMETLSSIQRWCDELTIVELASYDAEEIGKMVHLNAIQGAAILQAAQQFPTARITYKLQPLASDILKISLVIGRAFTWNSRLHGTTEPFWVWIEDEEGLHILQLAHLVFHQNTDALDLDFVLPIPQGTKPTSFTVRWVSDRWMGAEEEITISLDDLVMPPIPQCHTPLLLLPFLPVTAINQPLATLYANRFSTFNTIQTQAFWTLYHSRSQTLVCAPSGAGKTTLAEIIAQSTVTQSPGSWVIVVTPRKSTAQDIYVALRRGSEVLNIRVDYPPAHAAAGIYVTTPAILLAALTRRRPTDSLPGLDLVINDNLEQLDSMYELAISLLQLATQSEPTRYVGFGDSLHDPSDLASWLTVDAGSLYSSRPRDREQSLKISNHAFTMAHSAALFKAMGKPAHMAISEGLRDGVAAIAFVPSRGHCRTVALDLITWATLDSDAGRGYLPPTISEDATEGYRTHLQDAELGDFIAKGVGFYHHGMHKRDRSTILQLYVEGIVRVLVVPRDACWDLPVRASCVVVMGTQYVEINPETNLRRVRDYKLTDIVRMQSRAVQHKGTGHFHLFCQAEAMDTYSRFLNEGLPLESQLMETDHLKNWIKSATSRGAPLSKQDLFDFLSFTFLARRVASNPTYYGFTSTNRAENLSRMVDRFLEASPREIVV